MPVTEQHRQHASLAHAMLMSAHAQLTSRANDRVYRYFSFPIHNNVTTASMMPTTTRTSQVSDPDHGIPRLSSTTPLVSDNGSTADPHQMKQYGRSDTTGDNNQSSFKR